MFLELGKNKFRIELWSHNFVVFQMIEIDINLLKKLEDEFFEATNGIEICWNTSGERTTHMVCNFRDNRAIEQIHIQTFDSENFWDKERKNFVSSELVNNPSKEIKRIIDALTEWVGLYEIKNQKKSRLCKEENKSIKQSLIRQIILPKDRRT